MTDINLGEGRVCRENLNVPVCLLHAKNGEAQK